METDSGFLSQIILSKVSIEQIIQHYRPTYTPGTALITCLSRSHSDSTPSMKVYKNTNSVYCFGCGFSGNVISIVAKMEEVSLLKAMQLIKNWFDIKEDLVDLTLKERSNIQRNKVEFERTWNFYAKNFIKRNQKLTNETISQLEDIYVTQDLSSLKQVYKEIKDGKRNLL